METMQILDDKHFYKVSGTFIGNISSLIDNLNKGDNVRMAFYAGQLISELNYLKEIKDGEQ